MTRVNIRRKELCLFLAPLAVVMLAGAVILWKKAHPQQVTVYIGPFKNQAIRERSALRTLSAEIVKFPSARIYWVKEKGKRDLEERILFLKRYPPTGVLWMNLTDKDVSQYLLSYRDVTDEEIHATANKSGTFKDILKKQRSPSIN